MKNNGVTIIELLIVTSIISILVVIGLFSYEGWIGKYKVESATKELHTDLMDARSRAMQRDRMYFADFQAPTATTTSYRIFEDSNDDTTAYSTPATQTVQAGNTVLPTFPKTVSYTLSWTGVVPTNTLINVTMLFDKRGLISVYDRTGALTPVSPDPPQTIRVASTADPDYDCIVVSSTRINMGKWTTICNVK